MFRKLLLMSVLSIGMCGWLPADEQPSMALPVIELPKTSKVETTTAVDKLYWGARYVVKCTKECDVITFPTGLVEVEKKTGPRDWTAIFAGGTGDYEDKHFDRPFLYAVKAKKGLKGECTVYIIPREYKDRSEWVSVTLDVNGTSGPVIDPKPDPVKPDPAPDPKPVPDKVASKVVVVICEDLLQRTPTHAKIINDPEYRKLVSTGGGSVELVSIKDEAFEKNGYKFYADKTGLPCVLLFDADATGPVTPLSYFKMPDTGAELSNKIRKVIKK